MLRNRLIWGALWILSLVGISCYGGPISYGFFIMLTMVPIVSLLYLLYVCLFFHIYQKADGRWFVVNKPVSFTFILANEYFLSFVGVRVRFFTAFSTITDLSDETEYELQPMSRIKKETILVCKYRGEYEVGINRVEIQDYFRLFKISYKNPETLWVIVKPQLTYLDNIRSIDVSATMKETRINAGMPDVLTREYVPGDDPRQIHWNQTAKAGKLMTRELIGNDRQSISVVLDTFRQSEDEEVFLPVENKALEAVLAIVMFAINHNIPIREFHFEEGLRRREIANIAAFDDFYEYVSKIHFQPDSTQDILCAELNKAHEIVSDKVVFMILQSFGDEASMLAEKLSRNNVSTIAYVIGDENRNEEDFSQIARLKIVHIAPDDDLKEVL